MCRLCVCVTETVRERARVRVAGITEHVLVGWQQIVDALCPASHLRTRTLTAMQEKRGVCSERV